MGMVVRRNWVELDRVCKPELPVKVPEWDADGSWNALALGMVAMVWDATETFVVA